MYTPIQGPPTQRHPVGGRMFAGLRQLLELRAYTKDIDKTSIDRRVVEKGQPYSPSHFDGYAIKVLYPAESSKPYVLSQYTHSDEEGNTYDIYTKELSKREQEVLVIWDRTNKKKLSKLEFLVKKHNHHIH